MATHHRLIALLATAAAAASVQSCADGAAEILDHAAAGGRDGAALADAQGCVAGTLAVQVGAETHCRLSGVIDADLTLPAGPYYQIAGHVQFGLPTGALAEGARRTLTIAPGATLYAADRGALLEIARGARISAVGAADAPIVFTSAYDLGFDTALGLPPRTNIIAPRGEWGGLVVSGASDVNGVDGEAGAVCSHGAAGQSSWCERPGEAGTSAFGGAAGRHDSSGALRHIEIRYAGAFAQSGEGRLRVPALTLQGVGDSTQVSNVSIVNAYGDGLKLLGGWVQAENISVIGTGDDGVEWSYGYRGVLSNVVVAHDARLGDGDNGFEGSNTGLMADAALPASTPARPSNPIVSAPYLVNVSVIGDPAVSGSGFALRAGTDVQIEGAVISGVFAGAGLDIDGAESYALITGADLMNVAINTEGSPGLSTDFDDGELDILFAEAAGSNHLAPVNLSLAQAMLSLEEGLGFDGSQFALAEAPDAMEAAPVTLQPIRFTGPATALALDPLDLGAPALALAPSPLETAPPALDFSAGELGDIAL